MRKVILGAATLLAIGGGVAGGGLLDQANDRRQVAALLRLPRAPSSLDHVRCESWGLTDVLTTCVFEIAPAQTPDLLVGWPFEREPARGSSFSYAGCPRIGSAFAVATLFVVANPPQFSAGGEIRLVTDASRSHVQVDYYEE